VKFCTNKQTKCEKEKKGLAYKKTLISQVLDQKLKNLVSNFLGANIHDSQIFNYGGSRIPKPMRLRMTVEETQIMIGWELETSMGITPFKQQ